jgi:hypothetical protein
MAAVTAPELAEALTDQCNVILTNLADLSADVGTQYPNDPSAGIAGIYMIIQKLVDVITALSAVFDALAKQE